MKLTAFLFVVLLSATGVQAETVRLAIGEWAPYTSEKDPNGKLAEALVEEAFANQGIDTDNSYFPWKRSYEAVLKGQYLGTYPWYSNEEREQELIVNKEPLVVENEVLFHRTDTDFDWNNVEDLKGLTVGGTIGYSHIEVLEEAGIEVSKAASDEVNFRKLLAGRIDVFPASYIVGNNLINKTFSDEEIAQLTSHEKPFSGGNMYMLISREVDNGQAVADKLDEGLRQLKASGRYDEIIDQFLGN